MQTYNLFTINPNTNEITARNGMTALIDPNTHMLVESTRFNMNGRDVLVHAVCSTPRYEVIWSEDVAGGTHKVFVLNIHPGETEEPVISECHDWLDACDEFQYAKEVVTTSGAKYHPLQDRRALNAAIAESNRMKKLYGNTN